MDYVFYVITIIAFYAMLAQSLNFFSGTTGLVSLTHAGLFGLGAYGWAVFAKAGVPFALAAFGALGVVILSALLISVVAFRTRGDYFVIITLSIQAIIVLLLVNFSSVTNGPLGISGIPKLDFVTSRFWAMIGAVFSAFLVYLILWRIDRSSWGKNLRAIRDDETMLTSLGKNVNRIKTVTFLLSALIAAIVGVEYAQYLTFIAPTSFDLSESIIILAIVVAGGFGSIHGSLLAAILLIGAPEALRFVGIAEVSAGNVRQILYGIVLILVVFARGAGRAPAPRYST